MEASSTTPWFSAPAAWAMPSPKLLLPTPGGLGSGDASRPRDGEGWNCLPFPRPHRRRRHRHLRRCAGQRGPAPNIIFYAGGFCTDGPLPRKSASSKWRAKPFWPATGLTPSRPFSWPRPFPRASPARSGPRASLSARVGSIEDNRLGGWYSYRMSKAAHNMGLRTLAIELRRKHRDLICSTPSRDRGYEAFRTLPPARSAEAADAGGLRRCPSENRKRPDPRGSRPLLRLRRPAHPGSTEGALTQGQHRVGV